VRLPPGRPLFLCGPSGAGKTSVGRRTAALLGVPFVDLDERIVEQEGRPIPALFDAGEKVFREAEWRALARLLTDLPHPGTVVALGGGTLGQEGLLEAVLEAGTLVHLDAAPATLARRLAADPAPRPLVDGAEDPVARLAALRESRAPGYARAVLRVDTDGLGVDEAAVVLLRRLWDPVAGPWREPPAPVAPGLPAGRGVVAGPGAIPRAIDPASGEVPGGALVLLIDEDLPHVHAGALGPALGALPGESDRLRMFTVRGGESVKELGVAASTWEALLDAGVDRDGMLLGVGGGTVTDLAGVVAALYKRGLPLALVPTTLLAQLDAALGGKNALNLAGTKNVLGTVRFPREVAIDPLWLATLPRREVAVGLAEAVKSGILGDPGLLDVLGEAPPEPSLPWLHEVATRAARVKLGIVSRDPEERGERALLNLGHTLGHALEGAGAEGGPVLSHGEAVAIGTVFALRLAAASGVLADRELPDRVEALLRSLGLPVRPPEGVNRAALLRHLERDKKRREGRGRWVLPARAGEARVREVDHRTLLRELRAFFDDAGEGPGGEEDDAP